jgi:site-specific DNA-adenine methylase
MKALKTPLRYPGGKSRAVPKLFEFLPNKITEYREGFLGGGSMAIAITKAYPETPVWVNDLYEPLYNFWSVLQEFSHSLQTELIVLKSANQTPDKAKVLFEFMKEQINDDSASEIERAVAFYVVNKCSFSGLTESSSFSAQASNNNFTMRGIEKLTEYGDLISNWKITNLDYAEVMSDEEHCFMYMDPPYNIKDVLYGKKGEMHKGFDHARFADVMDANLGNVLISYNDHPDIKLRFDEWYQYDWDHTYTMRSTGEYTRNQKDRRELVLTNYDWKRKLGG